MRKEITIEELKNNMDDIFKEVNETDEPIYIKDEDYSCVIISEQEYERIINLVNEIEQYENANVNKLNQHILNELKKRNLTNRQIETIRLILLEICIRLDVDLIKIEGSYYNIELFLKNKDEKEKKLIIYEKELLTLDNNPTNKDKQFIKMKLYERLNN